MKRLLTVTFCLMLAACTGGPAVNGGQSSSSSSASSVMADIIVDSPASGSIVKSPLTITGRAKGTWYFEASFPVRLFDDQGNELAVAPAQAEGDWMTEDYVPFSVTLTFTTTAKTGTLVLEKDNPSGMPENAKSVSNPVQFAP